jgi:glutamate formiminotransferase
VKNKTNIKSAIKAIEKSIMNYTISEIPKIDLLKTDLENNTNYSVFTLKIHSLNHAIAVIKMYLLSDNQEKKNTTEASGNQN